MRCQPKTDGCQARDAANGHPLRKERNAADTVLTGVAGSIARVFESLQAVLESRVECEFRTTVHPDLIPPDSLTALAQALAGLGVRRYVVQEFRAQGCADAPLRASRVASYLDGDFCCGIRRLFESFEVRRG